MLSGRLQRTIRLLQMLHQRPGMTLREIADWLDCSERTVYRDLQLLKEMGFDLVSQDPGYVMRSSSSFPQAELSVAERFALLAASQTTPLASHADFRRTLRQALHRIIPCDTPEARKHWTHLVRGVHLEPNVAQPNNSQFLLRLAEAVGQGEALLVTWRPPDTGVERRAEMIPRQILGHRTGWDIIAASPDEQAEYRIRFQDLIRVASPSETSNARTTPAPDRRPEPPHWQKERPQNPAHARPDTDPIQSPTHASDREHGA